MDKNYKLAIIAVLMITALLLHLLRYQAQPLTNTQWAGYIESDRWLGKSRICSVTECSPWQ